MDKIIKRYSSLFKFPGYWLLVSLVTVVNVFGTIIAFTIVSISAEAIYSGLQFGLIILTLPSILVDAILSKSIIKDNVIMNLRRSTALSLFVSLTWIITINVGSALDTFILGSSLIYASFFAVGAAISLRLFVLQSITTLNKKRALLLSITQPLISLILIQNFWGIWSSSFLLAVVASTGILLTANQLFLYLVNRNGKLTVGIGSILLLKGFLANWLEGLTHPLEDYFEMLGITTTVYVKLFAFKVKQQLRGVLVIPQVHPGPFKNLGSSNLPYRIQKALEKKYNLIAAVSHGASGHELDLTSQVQCEKVIDEVLKRTKFSDFSKKATRLIRVKVDSAQTTCQFFGKAGLLTSTYSPKGMEDIPFDLGIEIMRQGESLGAKGVAFIDAHNSAALEKETPSFSERDELSLKTSTYKALEQSLKEKQDRFRMGIAKVIPEDFTLCQGLGPGGIVALVFIVDDQKAAYVTIDGNNMVNGLREEIINSLSDLVDDCEILTTDTHMVNAIITSGRGYHPVGEVMDNNKLFKHIKNAIMEALRKADWAETSYKSIVIRDVKVFGEERILNLMVFLDKISNYSKLIATVIYLPAILIAITPFLLI